MAAEQLQDVARQKAAARETAKAQRANAAAAGSVRGGEALLSWIDRLPRSRIVGAYVPVRGEMDPRPLAIALSGRDGAAMALPVVIGRHMRFRTWEPGEALREARHGLKEPAGGADVSPDFLLVPLLAFTRDGDRLGWGGGYYDRWLAGEPGVFAVGVAHAFQEAKVLPCEAHDQRLSMVLTERDAFVCAAHPHGAAPCA